MIKPERCYNGQQKGDIYIPMQKPSESNNEVHSEQKLISLLRSLQALRQSKSFFAIET
jgi:hypothetical protein